MPAAARIGDQDVPHCSGHNVATGSGDVFINGRGAARRGDSSTPHLVPGSPCSGHTAQISGGSGTVFVNGRPLARVGDAYASCTSIAQGSPDVFAN